ncbi:hypothetical protein BGZ49_009217 [Haplosporangium sp. Z 27]|nr:hypothetical protein BGZ49_009217 [Haplosporangium sp. Z 27]
MHMEYQANSPIRENHAVFPTPTYSYYSGHGSSEEVHELHPYAREGGALIDDQASSMMPPPSISAREDHYRPSPTLTASQTLAANYGAHPEPLYQSYLPYQPYSNQHALPSPSFTDAYRLNSNYASPGVGPLHSNHSYEERTEYKADPYRSAYSQSTSNHQSSSHAHPYGSSYQGSASGSPNPNEDFSSSFESKFSVISTQQNQQNNGSNIPRYPTRDLAGQESDQALSASSEENGSSQQQQQTPTPTEQRQKSTTTVSCETAGPFSDQDFPTTVDNTSGYTKPSSTRPSQLSKTEEDEDDVILQKLGVLSANSTRSGKTHSSGQSRKKGQWTDGSEEESQSKHGIRQRRRRVDHERAQSRRRYDQVCCCSCTTRVCAIVTLGILASLALILYFLIPRAPVFSFESVTSSNPPVTLVDRIQEPFNIQFMVDSSNNYLPIRLNRIGLGIWLDPEQARIADNDDLISSFVIQPRSQMISIPMTLEYKSKNNVQGPDNVLQDLVQVCTPVDLNTAITVPGMNITVAGVVHIWGFAWIWKPSFKLDIENVPCPINSRDLNSTPPLASSVSSTPSVTAASTVNTASVSPIEAYAAVETQVTTRTAQEYWKATITTRTDMAVQTA